ncbi:MAG: permease [Myxococcales bacterium]|nr:permease [Myxococcales bacterium]
MLHATWMVLLELAPWLLLGAAVAGLLHILLPPDFLARHLSGRWGVARAVLFGVPLPLCSCGVIPAGLSLKEDGASDGAAVGFLISTPQTGVDSLMVSAGFLGWPFALFKVGAAAATGLVGGWLTDRFGTHAGAPPPPVCAESNERSVRALVTHGLEMIRTIWRWLVFGVLASAALTAWVPTDALSGLGAWGVLGVLALSVPLYVCATASVPIAAALVAGGMPTGAALVFLMAGPATNIATIGAIYRGFGGRTLAIYLGTIVVGSAGLGWLFDFVIPAGGGALAAHAHGVAWWASASAGLLVALFAFFAVDDLRGWWRRRAPPAAQALELPVAGMRCGGCVRKLEGALNALEGVEAAVVEREPDRAIVRGPISEAAVRAAIVEAGFTPG